MQSYRCVSVFFLVLSLLVYLRVVCLITHIKPDIIKFFKHANDIVVVVFFFLEYALLSSFGWAYKAVDGGIAMRSWKGWKTQTRISLLNFHTFFLVFNWRHQFPVVGCVSGRDDFDSIICLSLTLIRLNNLIVVGNESLINFALIVFSTLLKGLQTAHRLFHCRSLKPAMTWRPSPFFPLPSSHGIPEMLHLLWYSGEFYWKFTAHGIQCSNVYCRVFICMDLCNCIGCKTVWENNRFGVVSFQC